MTQYAGESYLITHTATFDGATLTGPDVDEVTVTIVKGSGDDEEEILAETAMTWDPIQGRWEYLWDTASRDPGTYKAKFIITGVPALDSGQAFEFLRIRLARPPFA